MRRTRHPLCAVAIAIVTSLTACSTNRVLTVRTLPPSAQVYVNGELVGATPIDAIVPFDSSPRAFMHVVLPDHEAIETILYPATFPATAEVEYHLREN